MWGNGLKMLPLGLVLEQPVVIAGAPASVSLNFTLKS